MYLEEEVIYEEEGEDGDQITSKVTHMKKTKRGAGRRTPRRDSGWSSMTGHTFNTSDFPKLGGPLNPPAYSREKFEQLMNQ